MKVKKLRKDMFGVRGPCLGGEKNTGHGDHDHIHNSAPD